MRAGPSGPTILERSPAADEQIAPDCVDHASPPGTPPGPGPVKESLAALYDAVPDLELAIREAIGEGDRLVARNTSCGTDRGTLWGMPATGKSFEMEGIVIRRIANGKIAGRWATGDRLGMLQQFGVVPAPGGGA